eukprot:4166537-Prymnesium_polylepis.1
MELAPSEENFSSGHSLARAHTSPPHSRLPRVPLPDARTVQLVIHACLGARGLRFRGRGQMIEAIRERVQAVDLDVDLVGSEERIASDGGDIRGCLSCRDDDSPCPRGGSPCPRGSNLCPRGSAPARATVHRC